MSKTKILKEFETKYGFVVKGPKKTDFEAQWELRKLEEIRDFLSKALDTIEKETREKMAEALRMKYQNYVEDRKRDDIGITEGYNQAVDEFNKTIDNYLKVK